MGRQSKDLSSPTSSIGIKENSYNLGKGVIVDSGTTDTYLPRSVSGIECNRWSLLKGKIDIE